MIKKIYQTLLAVSFVFLIIACKPVIDPNPIDPIDPTIDFTASNPHHDVYYEIFVRSFADSDGDGIGDLQGIVENIDYLVDLGITALWLMPINPSPSYHGYDVTDYYDVNPDYGTLDDLQDLIQVASQHDIKIVLDLVINHTSDQHPWYNDARSSTSSPYRDFYIWQGNSAFESFVGGMKDLNLANEAVVDEVKSIMDFYLEMGIHGFRLDAAQHFFQNPGVTGVTLKNAFFILDINQHIKENYPGSFIVSEVFQYSYTTYVDYYIGSDSVFNFDIRQNLIEKIGQGSNRHLFTNNLRRMYNAFAEINPDFVDTPFITNHDLDRIASTQGLGTSGRQPAVHQMARVLLTLPGSPFIYYGDELGMKGYRDYGQTAGVQVSGYGTAYDEFRRTPFLWANETTLTTWFPNDTIYANNADVKTAEDQMQDSTSLFHTYKEIIAIRKATPALMYGNYFVPYQNNSANLQGYIRYYQQDDYQQAVLVLHNLSYNTIEINLDYLEVIFGELSISPFGTLILEIDPDLIGAYS